MSNRIKKIMQKGFTLIELMIVLAIIGILAAIATPAYQNYIAKTQVTEALNMVSSFKGEIVSFYGESNTCPTLTGIGLPPSGLLEARYIESLAISTPIGAVCAITFTFKSDDINEGLKSKNFGSVQKTVSFPYTVKNRNDTLWQIPLTLKQP